MPKPVTQGVKFNAPWNANGKDERLLVEVTEYRSVLYLSMRVWYKDERGNLRPGKNGISIPLDTIKGQDLNSATEATEVVLDNLKVLKAHHDAKQTEGS